MASFTSLATNSNEVSTVPRRHGMPLAMPRGPGLFQLAIDRTCRRSQTGAAWHQPTPGGEQARDPTGATERRASHIEFGFADTGSRRTENRIKAASAPSFHLSTLLLTTDAGAQCNRSRGNNQNRRHSMPAGHCAHFVRVGGKTRRLLKQARAARKLEMVRLLCSRRFAYGHA